MSQALNPALRPAVAAQTTAATRAATGDDVCPRLRNDPISLLPGDRQLPAFRLIYQLPRLYAEQGLRAVPRVFATWLFGDLNAKVIPYALPARGDRPLSSAAFGYSAYPISWSVVADSPTLARTQSAVAAALDQGVVRQIESRLLGNAKPGSRALDAYAAKAWKTLRVQWEAARTAAKPAQIDTGWLPLPSTGLHFYADVLNARAESGADVIPLSEASMIFGGANLYPLVRGRIVGAGAPLHWELVIDQWQQALVDRFSFEDDLPRSPAALTYTVVNAALRAQPGVIRYPAGRPDSQPLGLWDPKGHMRLKGSPENPVVELLNQSFVDFANEVARPLSRMRSQKNCTNVAALECDSFELIAIQAPTELPGAKPRSYPLGR